MPLLTTASGEIEYAWTGDAPPGGPTIVMLHEGLGSLSMWRDFPQRLADRTGCRVVAYSRYGYGNSTPLSAPRPISYMHDEALIVLPELLANLQVESPILFGHSDGASIALIHASRHSVLGVIALAPHVFVEDLSLSGVAAAGAAYEAGDLRKRLGRHHADVDGAFRGWHDAWLSPDFREWNIESLLPDIHCPVLAIQGQRDEYGTRKQLDRIQQRTREVDLLLLPDCRHAPHRDQPEPILKSVQTWMNARLCAHTRIKTRTDPQRV